MGSSTINGSVRIQRERWHTMRLLWRLCDNLYNGDMNEFIELVREMRDAQKEYFRTRDKNVLQRSKELERKVDTYISQRVINQQTSLF